MIETSVRFLAALVENDHHGHGPDPPIHRRIPAMVHLARRISMHPCHSPSRRANASRLPDDARAHSGGFRR